MVVVAAVAVVVVNCHEVILSLWVALVRWSVEGTYRHRLPPCKPCGCLLLVPSLAVICSADKSALQRSALTVKRIDRVMAASVTVRDMSVLLRCSSEAAIADTRLGSDKRLVRGVSVLGMNHNRLREVSRGPVGLCGPSG